jgi:UDP-glucose 4-epimerase
MNILVLGGDGFLGSHFVDRAILFGQKVTVFDRFQNNVSRNLEHQRGKIRFFPCEFANRKQMLAVLKNQDIVYYFINATNPVAGWNDPLIEIEKNLKPAVQFFELVATHSDVRKIVFPSSGGTIYGRQHASIKEDLLPNPFNPYGICKLATEHFLNYFQEQTGIATDIYRIGNAYGPRQPIHTSQGVIAVWMDKILKGDEIRVYGDQDTLRDYVYVEDIAQLMMHSTKDLEHSDVYNLGTGRGVSILGLLNIFQTKLDKPFKYRTYSRRRSDNTSSVLDSSKIVSFFPGFKFQRIEDNIWSTWLFVREQHYESNSKNK